ncbi:MAG: M14 family metallopeptidase [Actinomycetota bacterium]|nr:M14 family metallopeptidase [Actinomycetota bacterium]
MTTSADIRFDRFPRFEELTEWLHALAAESNGQLELSTIGHSYEGRELWLATVTNPATGSHDQKPALWIDGNIHASELTAATACLHLLHSLVTRYGSDEKVTRAVDRRTFYVVPRVNPDGAELALAELPQIVRSTVRPWPRTEQQPGFVSDDIDHDGRLLQMRVEDPNGSWKPLASHPRLLVSRAPDEDGPGPYYRLLREGTVEQYDGVLVPQAPLLAGLDSNRNFPVDWRRHPAQPSVFGSGDFPTSEPEVRAVVQAVVDRPNITSYLAYHTWSGVHLRPYDNQSDDAMPTPDLRMYKALGDKMTAITGYPSISVYHGFRYDPKDVITGTGSGWAYDQLGLISWTTEFWSPLRAAGLDDAHPIDWYIDHPLDEELQLLAWVEENAPDGYVDWYSFDHPQLGAVELGGWNNAAVFRNPPPALLEAEIAPHTEAMVFHALIAPELRLHSTEVVALGDGSWRVRLVVENAGWLPTNVTSKAIERKVAQEVEATIALPDGVTLAAGSTVVKMGHLAGRIGRTTSIGMFAGLNDLTSDRAKAEWVVVGPPGSVVQLTAATPRAGAVHAAVTLGA